MYIMALYIGVSSTVLSYLYLMLLPIYAQHINAGHCADESLWWQCLRQLLTHRARVSIVILATTALLFGAILSFSLVYSPWVQNSWVNLLAMTVWLACLWFLARIDQLCYLLPDVLTQTLLWLGLALVFWRPDIKLESLIITVISLYLVGRLANQLGYYFSKKQLFGQGDIKLVAALTVWLGGMAILSVGFWACVLCWVCETAKQRTWRPTGACAFGPYLVYAALLVWLFPHEFVFDW